MKRSKDDLVVDLNNNSENKTEALEPQRKRKAKFGPFETSFDEEEENHKNQSHFKASNGILLLNHLQIIHWTTLVTRIAFKQSI